MDQYAKDRADIDQLHKDLEHQIALLTAQNRKLRLGLERVQWWLAPVADIEPNAHGAMMAVNAALTEQ